MLPDAIVDTFYANITGASFDYYTGGYTYPCNTTLPDLSLNIGGHVGTVPGAYFNYTSVGSGRCFGGLQTSTGLAFSIVGDIFLKSQFVVFSGAETPQLGFAAKTL